MPGNSDLELVRQIAETSGGLPVIILTGFPAVRSAVACIELPVAAYLVKPVVFPELLSRVEAAVARFRSFRALESAEHRLRDWRREFEGLSSVQRGRGASLSADELPAGVAAARSGPGGHRRARRDQERVQIQATGGASPQARIVAGARLTVPCAGLAG